MSPYNALTATCFWYAVSSEFFSYDFSAKRHANDTANELFEKIQKLPLPIPNRVIKTVNANPSLLESETEELNRLGCEMSERMATMIPAQLLTYRAESIERKLTPSTVS